VVIVRPDCGLIGWKWFTTPPDLRPGKVLGHKKVWVLQDYFNRKARAETDLYELAAKAMNTFVEGNIERYRGR
jgi:hypothetical protein